MLAIQSAYPKEDGCFAYFPQSIECRVQWRDRDQNGPVDLYDLMMFAQRQLLETEQHIRLKNYFISEIRTMKEIRFYETIIVCISLSFAAPIYADTPWLHTDANLIKDPAGNTVVLRGVDTIDIGAV